MTWFGALYSVFASQCDLLLYSGDFETIAIFPTLRSRKRILFLKGKSRKQPIELLDMLLARAIGELRTNNIYHGNFVRFKLSL